MINLELTEDNSLIDSMFDSLKVEKPENAVFAVVKCDKTPVGIAAFSPKKSLTRVFGLSGISQKIRPDAPVKGAAQRIYGVYSKQRYSFLYFYAKLSYSSAAASV